MSLQEALKKAEDMNLDLVEWGKYQYQKMKDQQKNRRQAKSGDLKQMRFGLKIGAGDLEVKLKKIRKFLENGHKVRIQVVYKGREMAHKEIGYELIDKVMDQLSDDAILEQKPQMAGRNLSVVIRSK